MVKIQCFLLAYWAITAISSLLKASSSFHPLPAALAFGMPPPAGTTFSSVPQGTMPFTSTRQRVSIMNARSRTQRYQQKQQNHRGKKRSLRRRYSDTVHRDDSDEEEDLFGDYGNDNHTLEHDKVISSEASNDQQEEKSHFYSQKSLQDPKFYYRDDDGTTSSLLFDNLCAGAGISKPSRIQSLAWPILVQGNNAIVADQTGSGKTLAYLLPLLQRALSSRPRRRQQQGRRINGAPSILILAPTAELANQIYTVCDRLASEVAFRAKVISATTSSPSSSDNIRSQIRMLQNQPVDVLIATPGRIATILRSRNSGGLDLSSNLQAIVLDEVDVMFMEQTFGPQLRTISAAAGTPVLNKVQFVFVTATLPDSVVESVRREFPNIQQVRGPGLHKVAPTVRENLVDVSVPPRFNRDAKACFEIKAQQLLKALRQNRCRRTLIFCNTVETCRNVENLLKRHDRKGQIYRVGAYHNAMTPQARQTNLQVFAHGTHTFLSSSSITVDDDNDNYALVDGGAMMDTTDHVLVCTDRAARGVDFDAAPVDHVVLFDFPKDPAEYVRRVGRTARAGRTGVSTVFAYGYQLPIARQVMGSKLESFTIAGEDEDEDDDYDYEYKGGVQGRAMRQKARTSTSPAEQMIKRSIQGGRLWIKDQKQR